jgi:hypothetical protein
MKCYKIFIRKKKEEEGRRSFPSGPIFGWSGLE